MFTKAFWSYSGERALKTFAQTAIAYLGTGEVLGLFSIDYTALFSLAGGAALLSVLTSVVTKSKT
jgi:hypothetical protein